MIQFDLPKEDSSIIKVIGVGGGGSNAVNNMYSQGIRGVNFLICNTDAQALELSPVPNKIQLGPSLTEGRGAGNRPQVGREATIESEEEIKAYLSKNTKMVFITAGMGGGTGTGGAPMIAKICKELDILTVGIVTTPFSWEGKMRHSHAEEGLEEFRQNVDTLLVISNDKLREICGNLTVSKAFAEADQILSIAARGIAEIITVTGYINVDFEDVYTVMKDSGVAILGSAEAEGENRARKVVEDTLASPLLNDNDIRGAKNILLNITSGSTEVTMDEITEITEFVQSAAGNTADIIWGNCFDENLGDRINLTIIATGFEASKMQYNNAPQQKVFMSLDDETPRGNAQSTSQQPSKPEPKKSSRYGEEQITFEFDLDNSAASKPDQKPSSENVNGQEDESFNPVDKIPRLKNMVSKLKTPSNLLDLEKQPAYMRRNIQLKDVPHSSDSQLSRFSLTDKQTNEEDDNKPQIGRNNSFLHDNVD